MTTSTPGEIAVGRQACRCAKGHHACRLIAVTGGPGAGKTAVLEVARQVFCEHIAFVPEAATIVFSGGFWRRDSVVGRKAAQRVIFHAQRELEVMLVAEGLAAVGLCDRGTIDGAAYWPEDPSSLWRDVGVTLGGELERYAAVIHLRTPKAEKGYNFQNPMRIESARDAARLDDAILKAWESHPHRTVIDAEESFALKVRKTLGIIRDYLPACCQTHLVDEELVADSPCGDTHERQTAGEVRG